MINDLDPELEREASSSKVSQTDPKKEDAKLLDELDKELAAIGDPDAKSEK